MSIENEVVIFSVGKVYAKKLVKPQIVFEIGCLHRDILFLKLCVNNEQ